MRGQPTYSRASRSHGRNWPDGVSNSPIGALIAAASNVGRKSSTSIRFGSTKHSSAATVMPARRAGNTSQPPGHGVTPAMFLKGDFFTTTENDSLPFRRAPGRRHRLTG